MLLPRLNPRKEAILALTPLVELGAEVGADHGLISAQLLEKGICRRMLVSDISAASLDKARRLFHQQELTDRAHFRVADGLDGMPEPPQAIVIAGMGAKTIIDILETGKEKIGDAALILQPNPDPPALRRYLVSHGFYLEDERLAYEGGRYYVIMRARKGLREYTEKELLLGPWLIKARPEGYEGYLNWRLGCFMREIPLNENAVGYVKEELDALHGGKDSGNH